MYQTPGWALSVLMTQLVEVPLPDVKHPATKRRRRAMPTLADLSDIVPTKFGPVWRLIQRIRPLERAANRLLINVAIERLPPRPYRLSTKRDFTTQDTLTDRTYNCRQLEATRSHVVRTTPDLDAVVGLFERETFIPCEKSTVLFAYVAQWFTDGFLRSDRSAQGDKRDIRRNESTHEVDLAQLYGLNEDVTRMLRDAEQPMLLASQGAPGEELPPALYHADGERVAQFAGLRMIGTTAKYKDVDKTQLLAMGSDASNTQIGYAMLNTLFLREHNRVAREIAEENPAWSDDRIFAAARSVLTVLLIKVVIEEYINHIHPFHFEFRFDPRGFDKRPWMRPNWVAVEFNLLYRWHSLIPDGLDIGTRTLRLDETTFRTKELLSRHGLDGLVDSASRQRAGRIGLRNTPAFLLARAELPSVEAGRKVRLRGYNEYREACRFRRAQTFEDISSDPRTVDALRDVYGHVDEVELYTGLFAEDVAPNAVVPPLMGRLVGLHAFSQLMTNPLFAPELYNAKTFSERGMEIIDERPTLAQIVRRNIPEGSPPPLVALTREDWKRV
jgi:prostaglandin-endoperoxide synthase 2